MKSIAASSRKMLRRGTVLFVFLSCIPPTTDGRAQPPSPAGQADAERTGRIVQPHEGEVLRLRSGQLIIKADPKTGSPRSAMGTQQLNAGAGIGVHRHERADEILFVHAGKGTAILGEERKALEPGTVLYIPAGTWHGIENPDEELLLFWVASPPGSEEAFREIGTPLGAEPKQLTPQQVEDILRKYGTIRKPK